MAIVIDYPTSLPQSFTLGSYSEKLANNIIATEMDVGYKKIRRRGTSASKEVSGSLILTSAQLDTFRTFYEVTTGFGSLRFLFDGYEVRFMSPPEITSLSGNLYSVQVQLEYIRPAQAIE